MAESLVSLNPDPMSVHKKSTTELDGVSSINETDEGEADDDCSPITAITFSKVVKNTAEHKQW